MSSEVSINPPTFKVKIWIVGQLSNQIIYLGNFSCDTWPKVLGVISGNIDPCSSRCHNF